MLESSYKNDNPFSLLFYYNYSMAKQPLDLLIIGGGPAGMSAALVAGRSLLDTLVINEESPRNKVTTASHGFLTRDGAHPLELLEISKQQLEKYETVEYLKDEVISSQKSKEGFKIVTQNGHEYLTQRLIVATGYKDNLEQCNLPGLEAVYGKSVYPCPFCDGWEHRDQQLALFGSGEFVGTFARLIQNWSSDLIIFTNGDTSIDEDIRTNLKDRKIHLEERPVEKLVSDENGYLVSVKLKGGDIIERQAGFIMDSFETPASDIPQKLGVGLVLGEWGMQTLDVKENGATDVPGLYIVGDARSGFGGIATAVQQGASCVENIVHEMIFKD